MVGRDRRHAKRIASEEFLRSQDHSGSSGIAVALTASVLAVVPTRLTALLNTHANARRSINDARRNVTC